MGYTIRAKKKLPKALCEFEIEIPAEDIAPRVRRVLAELTREAELPGFRKGFVPEKIVRERMGEFALFEKAAGEALAAALLEICKEEEIDAIGQPSVSVTLCAPGNPLRAKITVAEVPHFALPDYKKIAAGENEKPFAPEKVGDKEVDAVIDELRKIRAGEDPKSPREVKEVQPLTDDTAKQFGNFNSVAELKAAVAENLKRQKEEQEKQKRRGALLAALVSEMKVELPDILIQSELARMGEELKGELERFGGTMEKYLADIKKTADEFRNELRPDAEHRARVHLLLHKIAQAESISAPPEKVDEEVRHILSLHKHAQPNGRSGGNADPEAVRFFVETLLMNQKVIQFLEDQK